MKLLVSLVLILAFSSHSRAAITLAPLFQDGCVLQAEPLPAQIWGTSNSADEIEVEIACESGHTDLYLIGEPVSERMSTLLGTCTACRT